MAFFLRRKKSNMAQVEAKPLVSQQPRTSTSSNRNSATISGPGLLGPRQQPPKGAREATAQVDAGQKPKDHGRLRKQPSANPNRRNSIAVQEPHLPTLYPSPLPANAPPIAQQPSREPVYPMHLQLAPQTSLNLSPGQILPYSVPDDGYGSRPNNRRYSTTAPTPTAAMLQPSYMPTGPKIHSTPQLPPAVSPGYEQLPSPPWQSSGWPSPQPMNGDPMSKSSSRLPTPPSVDDYSRPIYDFDPYAETDRQNANTLSPPMSSPPTSSPQTPYDGGPSPPNSSRHHSPYPSPYPGPSPNGYPSSNPWPADQGQNLLNYKSSKPPSSDGLYPSTGNIPLSRLTSREDGNKGSHQHGMTHHPPASDDEHGKKHATGSSRKLLKRSRGSTSNGPSGPNQSHDGSRSANGPPKVRGTVMDPHPAFTRRSFSAEAFASGLAGHDSRYPDLRPPVPPLPGQSAKGKEKNSKPNRSRTFDDGSGLLNVPVQIVRSTSHSPSSRPQGLGEYINGQHTNPVQSWIPTPPTSKDGHQTLDDELNAQGYPTLDKGSKRHSPNPPPSQNLAPSPGRQSMQSLKPSVSPISAGGTSPRPNASRTSLSAAPNGNGNRAYESRRNSSYVHTTPPTANGHTQLMSSDAAPGPSNGLGYAPPPPQRDPALRASGSCDSLDLLMSPRKLYVANPDSMSMSSDDAPDKPPKSPAPYPSSYPKHTAAGVYQPAPSPLGPPPVNEGTRPEVPGYARSSEEHTYRRSPSPRRPSPPSPSSKPRSPSKGNSSLHVREPSYAADGVGDIRNSYTESPREVQRGSYMDNNGNNGTSLDGGTFGRAESSRVSQQVQQQFYEQDQYQRRSNTYLSDPQAHPRQVYVARAPEGPTPIPPEELQPSRMSMRLSKNLSRVPPPRLIPSPQPQAQLVASPQQQYAPSPRQSELEFSPRGKRMSRMSVERLPDIPKAQPAPVYPFARHMMDYNLLAALLPFLSIRDWLVLTEVNDALRRQVEHTRDLRELVLERFLKNVGYERWRWEKKEPLMLTFRDINGYMRGTSIPTHRFAKVSFAYLEAKQKGDADKSAKSLLASACRAYTRIVLRLRAQAEALSMALLAENPQPRTLPKSSSAVNVQNSSSQDSDLPSSPSSTNHTRSISHGQAALLASPRSYVSTPAAATRQLPNGSKFESSLFTLGRAPLLRVFVPSPDSWLSDESILDCEKELKRAGVLSLLRVGDIVWDVAVGDEMNVGRMVWDGNYLIDLDYTWSHSGDIPAYLHSLAFPPSYFHRVVRTSGNPICYIDISPWGEQIQANLSLVQDRVKMETPQGGHHNVVRWVYRSTFIVRAHSDGSHIPIPGQGKFVIHPSWYGSIVVEAEGTNEGQAELHERCKGPPKSSSPSQKSSKRIWRLLRERSRPGEIWIRIVKDKERLI